MPKPSRETAKFNFLDWNNKVLVSSFKKIGLNVLLIIILDFLKGEEKLNGIKVKGLIHYIG